jgi:ribosomal protein L37AE/L43A
MPCNTCGHPNKAHKKMTSSIYFCEDCKVVESYVSFSVEAGEQVEDIDSSLQSTSTQDLLSEVYRAQRLRGMQSG